MDECTVSNGGNKEERRQAQEQGKRRWQAQDDKAAGLSIEHITQNTHTPGHKYKY